MTSQTDTQAPAAVADPPTPFLKGIFSIFDLPDGGILIVYRPEGAENDEHIPIPAVLAQVLRGMRAGQAPSLSQMMRIMASLREL